MIDTNVVRGGAYDDYEIVLRCAICGRFSPHNRFNLVGFRAVRDSNTFVLRGGAFSSNRNTVRLAHRYSIGPDNRYSDVGFRVARNKRNSDDTDR